MTIHELLEEYNIPVAPAGHHHTSTGWVQFDCPFCGRNSGGYHMGYNLSGGFVNCWRCGAHSLAAVLQEYTGLPYKKINVTLRNLDRIRAIPATCKTKGRLVHPIGVGPLRVAHQQYLRRRGFNHKTIKRLWQISGIGLASHLSWRLFIPIYNKGRQVSWTTRSLSDRAKGPRYISAPPQAEILPHKEVLYGWDYVRHTAIIVEGPLDVWAIGPGATATFGTIVTPAQIRQLCSIPRRIVCFDNDTVAQRQAKKLCDKLGAFPGETLNVTLDANDPADADADEIRRLKNFLK
jgi:hypothetical protein